MAQSLDPVTLEVLRHRLWMINDEQGRIAAQISGSPVVYESKDFNASLLTADGRSIFVGVYTTRISLCLEATVRWVQEHYAENPGIAEGDAFVTNDPWAGAAHQNDVLMVAPIFAEGQLLAWTGIAMHEVDVGGPNPGSFTVGAQSVFGEGPLIPPVKLVEGGRLRADIEAWVVRNSRTPELNGLDLRARLAAIHRTRQRLLETIEEYGVATVLAAEEHILGLAQAAFRRRLKSLPDGQWQDQGFLDHDGNTSRWYRIAVTLTKQGDMLELDFTGTDDQATGSVNCTEVGLQSGVLSAILPMLCYDMPWSPGAILPLLRIRSAPGTINHAEHPAGVSMATVAATFATQHVVAGAIAKMLSCSQLAAEVQSNWCPAWQGMTLNGQLATGRPFTAVLLDQAGGGGARLAKDGPDTSGLPGCPAQGIANVETYEKAYPILYVYRKQSRDTGGAGAHRGGVGMESLMVPHGGKGPMDVTVLTHGGDVPEARGLGGGYPGSVQVRLWLRGSHLRAGFAEGRLPGSHEAVLADEVVRLASKARFLMQPDDAVLVVSSGGGGMGDPLRRDPAAVRRDVALGLVSPAVAEAIYGVVADEDETATRQRRQLLREARVTEGRWVGGEVIMPSPVMRDDTETISHAALHLGMPMGGGAQQWVCVECGLGLGPVNQDPKQGALCREAGMEPLSAWNRFGDVERTLVREFFCPGCGTMLAVEVRQQGDGVLAEMRLGQP